MAKTREALVTYMLSRIKVVPPDVMQILLLKCTKIDFRWGCMLRNRLRLGAYNAPPILLAVFKGT